MADWLNLLKYDPIEPLLKAGDIAIQYFVKRDLLQLNEGSIEEIWVLKEPQSKLKKQTNDGFWKSNTRNRIKAPAVNYDLFETFKAFSILIDKYEFNISNIQVEKAAEYLFSCQTNEGDIRGIIGEQYAPYYTGLIMSLLIKAGYENDIRIKKGFDWLLKMRQNDGGWVIGSPGCYGNYLKDDIRQLTTHYIGTKRDFDFSKPFTHCGTGMVLRAFAVHPNYRKTEESLTAANLIKQKFFLKDNSSSYQHPDNWINFKYPFFWTDLISVLDSLSLIGISKDDKDIRNALNWLINNQLESGLWDNSYSKIHKNHKNERTFEVQLWISLAICRIFKRFYTYN